MPIRVIMVDADVDAVVAVDVGVLPEDAGADAANNAEEVDTATHMETVHMVALIVKLPAQTTMLQPHFQT